MAPEEAVGGGAALLDDNELQKSPCLVAKLGEVLNLLDNETGMHSWTQNPSSPVGAGGKRRHPRGDENTGLGADKPDAQ